MRTVNVLISAVHLMIVLFLFGLGYFFLMVYFNPKLLLYFVEIIINKPGIVLKIGSFALGLSFFLFMGFYYVNKAQYLKFSMKKNQCQIDANLIRSYVEKYFASSYPGKKHKIDVCILPKEKIEIIASVDTLDNQKEFLLNIEEKLGKLLSEHLDYQKEFIFTLKSRK